MSERLNNLPGYAVRNFDYFLGRPDQADKRAEMMARGLIPINNLGLFFTEQDPELAPGIRNPMCRANQPFGHLIDRLCEGQPELWQRAVEAEQASVDASNALWRTLEAGDPNARATVMEAAKATHWHRTEVLNEVFRILAPQMEAEGLDPLSACL